MICLCCLHEVDHIGEFNLCDECEENLARLVADQARRPDGQWHLIADEPES